LRGLTEPLRFHGNDISVVCIDLLYQINNAKIEGCLGLYVPYHCAYCSSVGSQDNPMTIVAVCDVCGSRWSACKSHVEEIYIEIDELGGCHICNKVVAVVEICDLHNHGEEDVDNFHDLSFGIDLRKSVGDLVDKILSIMKGFDSIGVMYLDIAGVKGNFKIIICLTRPEYIEKPISTNEKGPIGSEVLINLGYTVRIYRSNTEMVERKNWLHSSSPHSFEVDHDSAKYHLWDGLTRSEMITIAIKNAKTLHDTGCWDNETKGNGFPVLVDPKDWDNSTWQCLECYVEQTSLFDSCTGCGKSLNIEHSSSRSRYVSSKVRQAVFARDQGKCAICLSQVDIEYDHIIPFEKGGSNSEKNIQLLCKICNRKKSNKIQ
jgi:hypothetical protein